MCSSHGERKGRVLCSLDGSIYVFAIVELLLGVLCSVDFSKFSYPAVPGQVSPGSMRFKPRCDQRANCGVLFFVFLVPSTVVNFLWYASSYVSPNARKPVPSAILWQTSVDAYNMSLLDEVTDFTTLVDKTDFRFLINNRRCDDAPDIFLVIFIHSAPDHFQKRRAIRKTWGQERHLVDDLLRIVFMVGEVQGRGEVQKALERESYIHRDMVQGNFLDTYKNLTYKHVMGLKWVTYFCRQAKYIFKTDDDIFVDIFQLVTYLKGSLGLAPPRGLIMCFLIRNPYVKRSQRSKWRVSFKEYPGKYYPPYCAGWGIIMSPDVVFNLYLQSTQVPYFWVDDVHVSGTLAQRAGVNHVDFTNKLSVTKEEIFEWLQSPKLSRPYLFGHPMLKLTPFMPCGTKPIGITKGRILEDEET
ncbi:beta-1,3-galactosyltransferase 5-like isoform X1 [Tachypleus tridentatus]|uniref:beta-1,3-galactosyltransferase 5-like isoform X1 n=2 Tax=Tachypleus tridentatus TaxID=6853 RepID=UPI003FD0F3A8